MSAYLAKDMDHVYSHSGLSCVDLHWYNCLYRELLTYTMGSLDSCCPRNKFLYMPKKSSDSCVVLRVAVFYEIIKLK